MQVNKLIKAAVLIALVLFGALYSYIEFVEAPLKHEYDALQLKITMANNQAASDGEQLHKLLNEEKAEERNQAIDQLLERMMETVPKTPQVYCPSLITSSILRHGIANGKVSIASFLPFKGLHEGTLQSWALNVPEVKPLAMCEAIADLENQLPLAQISEISIVRNPQSAVVHSECTIQFATFR